MLSILLERDLGSVACVDGCSQVLMSHDTRYELQFPVNARDFPCFGELVMTNIDAKEIRWLTGLDSRCGSVGAKTLVSGRPGGCICPQFLKPVSSFALSFDYDFHLNPFTLTQFDPHPRLTSDDSFAAPYLPW